MHDIFEYLSDNYKIYEDIYSDNKLLDFFNDIIRTLAKQHAETINKILKVYYENKELIDEKLVYILEKEIKILKNGGLI